MGTKDSSELGSLRDVLKRSDPEFLQVLEDGLRCRDRARWAAVAHELRICNGGWLPLIRDLIPGAPEAICWLIAAGRLEFYQSGANPERSIAHSLRKIPELEQHLEELEDSADPWVRRMAREARRILT
jgi:hypothetical protein